MYFTIDDFRQIFSDETNQSSKWPTKSGVSWRHFECSETAMVLNVMNRFRIRVYGFMFVSFPVYHYYINLTILRAKFFIGNKKCIHKIYIVSRGKWNMRAKWNAGCLEKCVSGVGLFSRQLDFCDRLVQRHTSKSIDHVLSISQKLNFTLLLNQFTHVLHQLLWQIK